MKNNYRTQIRLFWIPSHRNIEGNELADTAVKLSTENPPSELKIPHTDLFTHFKTNSFLKTHKTLIKESENKGKDFFANYYERNKNKLGSKGLN